VKVGDDPLGHNSPLRTFAGIGTIASHMIDS
jgi:hypothetical protein